MRTEAKSIKELVPTEVDPKTLPNGSYSGIMSGYSVTIQIAGKHYEIITKDGVRGMNCPCTVYIVDGAVTVS